MSVVLNLDTKKEIMTQLRLKILNHLYFFWLVLSPVCLIVFSRLMTDLCQAVSWLILFHLFAEMEYSKSKTKQKLLVPKNFPSSTTNSKEWSKYSQTCLFCVSYLFVQKRFCLQFFLKGCVRYIFASLFFSLNESPC